MPPAAKKLDPKSEQTQVHIRLPDDVIALVDKRAAEMEREIQKVTPGITVSRVEAVQAIITQALRK